MSDRAVMPLSDYVSACDTIREKIPEIVLVDKTIYREMEGSFTETLVTGTLIEGEQYSIKYTDTGLGNYDEGGTYSASLVNVPNVGSVLGMAVVLKHPADENSTHTIYVYQSGDNIMLYVADIFSASMGSVSISVSAITGKIVSGELSEKINEVYEAGQAQGEREMWDGITANNTRKTYEAAFRDWDSEYIRPPYKIYPKAKRSTGQMFCQNNRLKKVEAAYFDFSQKERGTANGQEGHYFTFYQCWALEEVEDIGFQPDYSYSTTFGNCTNLKKIAVIRSDENTRYADTFAYAYAIEYVRFEGVIGQNGLNLRWSTKLTYDSCHSIFTHLKDFRTTIVENYADTANKPCEFAIHTLTEGDKYYLIYESNNTIYKAEATVQNVYVGPSGISAVGVEFTFPQESEGEVPLAWVYQDGEKLMYDAYFNRTNGKITLIKGATETRTITMPKAVKDNGNASPEDIAEATERGWTIAWKE